MKIVLNQKIDNPYKKLKPTNKSLSIFEGRYYTSRSYEIENPMLRRLKLFTLLILSCGFILCHKKITLKDIFKAKKFQEVLVPRKMCKVSATENLQTQMPTEVARVSMQEHLNVAQIPLNCLNPAALTEPNHLRRDNIQTYLDDLRQRNPEGHALMHRLFENVEIINFQELQNALNHCTEKLKNLLENQNYSVGFVSKKSQQWIAELSLPYLPKAPVSFFKLGTEIGNVDRGQQSTIDPNCRNLVVFDDASYSGNQLVEIVLNIKKQIKKQNLSGKRDVHLVVPFVSKRAEKALLNWLNSIALQTLFRDHAALEDVKVHLITSQRKIKGVNEVFNPHELDALIKLSSDEFHQGAHSFVKKALHAPSQYETEYKSLTMMEWKIADEHSVVEVIKEAKPRNGRRIQFVTDFCPPYKRVENVS